MHAWGGRKTRRPSKSPYLISAAISVREADAAGAAAAGQDLTAVGGSHPLPEPVDLAALTLLGLVGTTLHLLHFPAPPVHISAEETSAATTSGQKTERGRQKDPPISGRTLLL